MTFNPTLRQSGDDRRRAKELSLKRTQPPLNVPGYEAKRFLGEGAYGEVWLAVDRRTGRHVAIKFYTHRGGLDWSLLSREVEKLRFLFADRYVVQLLDVGWDTDPPYLVMEFMEQGSLEDRLANNPLTVSQAVELCKSVAIGLVHAHDKGVLHCDLKPANILLDHDGHPRLADFGQARLSHEQSPALGTLFYMAPEQADMTSIPDARWDVYALGALLYKLVTGEPPHYSPALQEELGTIPEIEKCLARYRDVITKSPKPQKHRLAPGVDRGLGEIIDRCLEPDPARRFPNVQTVLGAFKEREAKRSRRPLFVLGAIGPAFFLLVTAWFSWQGFNAAVLQLEDALTQKTLESNQFAAKLVARTASQEIDRRFFAVEHAAQDANFLKLFRQTLADPELKGLLAEFEKTPEDHPDADQIQKRFIEHPRRKQLERHLQEMLKDPRSPKANTWLVTDARGNQWARGSLEPAEGKPNEGKNFARRTYFHGGPEDREEGWQAGPDDHIGATHLSAVFFGTRSQRWLVAVSTPLLNDDAGHFMGVLVQTVHVENLVEFARRKDQFSVLCDWREGTDKGLVLQHPLFDQVDRYGDLNRLVGDFKKIKVDPKDFSGMESTTDTYRDPIANTPKGADYAGQWLAARAPVMLGKENSDLQVIVQERQESALHPVRVLSRTLFTMGGTGLVLIVCGISIMWGFVVMTLSEKSFPSRNVLRWLRSRGDSQTPSMKA